MNPLKVFISNLLTIALLASCKDETAQQRIEQLDKTVSEQKNQLHETTDKLREALEWNRKMSDKFDALEQRLKIVFQMQALEPSLFRTPDPFVMIDAHQKSFASVQTNNGTLLVSILDIQPHLDGFKVTLQIGNPYNMTYSGLSVSMRCGSSPPEFQKPTSDDTKSNKEALNWVEQYVSWKNTLKTKSTSYADQLLPGKWSKVEFMLAPVTNADLAFMQVAIATNEVLLLPGEP